MPNAASPKSVVLNLLRVSGGRSAAVKSLVEVGHMFGFSSNAIRVAVARLGAEGLLESDERGSYRLGPAATAVSAHVEDWRRGEERMRPWGGGWLCVALPPKTPRAQRRRSHKALRRLGLRDGLHGLWVRPDNLSESRQQTAARLAELGLEREAELFVSEGFSAALVDEWTRSLWPVAELSASYERALAELERSIPLIEQMPRQQALVQSFLLGGEAIRVLATDPLLPSKLIDCGARARLTETMLRYDVIGRKIWKGAVVGPTLKAIDGGKK